MKKLLLILLCLPIIGFGQTDNILKLQDDVLRLQDDVNDINYRMDKHHKQFYNGVILSLVGFGATAAGVLASVNPIIYIGSALVLSGNIVVINSHKWFKNKDMNAIKKEDAGNKIKKRTKQLDRLLKSGEISKQEYNKAIKYLNTLKQ
tara:strand:- start:14 stop:457 length:444 start_codon:yes stop_codon:yes gene_type:complete